MGALGCIPDAVFPEDVALPIEFLDESGATGDEERIVVIGIAGAHQVAVLQQVRGAARGVG